MISRQQLFPHHPGSSTSDQGWSIQSSSSPSSDSTSWAWIRFTKNISSHEGVGVLQPSQSSAASISSHEGSGVLQPSSSPVALNILAVLCSSFLCPFVRLIAMPFSSVLFGLAFLLTSEIRFPLSGFFSLDSLRAVSTRLPGRRYKPTVCVLLYTTFYILPWRRYKPTVCVVP
jgi:hypothetical protein